MNEQTIRIEDLHQPMQTLAARAVANAVSTGHDWYVNLTSSGFRVMQSPADKHSYAQATHLIARPDGRLVDAKTLIPTTVNHPLIRVDDPEHEALQALMHGDDVKIAITSGHFPTVFHDPDYPDLIVVWDHGEGPHNPTTYTDEHVQNEGWLNLWVYPPKVWELVTMVAKAKGLANEYVVFWLRGADHA